MTKAVDYEAFKQHLILQKDALDILYGETNFEKYLVQIELIEHLLRVLDAMVNPMAAVY